MTGPSDFIHTELLIKWSNIKSMQKKLNRMICLKSEASSILVQDFTISAVV